MGVIFYVVNTYNIKKKQGCWFDNDLPNIFFRKILYNTSTKNAIKLQIIFFKLRD